MRDTKALQAGTSHMLGQNFARAAGIEFLDRDNQRKHPYGTSWGFTTRMVGATIMAHGDDQGMVLPPNVAPVQVVVIPISRTDEERAAVEAALEPLERELRTVMTASGPLRWQVDRREESPGFKFNHWELRGVPLRLEIGPRDVAAEQAVLVRRLDRAKETLSLNAIGGQLAGRLAGYQQEVFQRAIAFRAANSHEVDDYDTFKATVEERGGFLYAHWCGDSTCERQINEETGATIRVIPFESSGGPGKCLIDGRPSSQRVLFARA